MGILRALSLVGLSSLLVSAIACSSTDGASPDGTDPSGSSGGTSGGTSGTATPPPPTGNVKDGDACTKGNECQSGVCKSGVCAAPGPDDGVKNADETDVDCGGSKAPKCASGKGCASHGDCESDACSYAKKCVDAKGCTAHAGGDTCGAGETGAADAKHESCCTTVAIPDFPGGAIKMDKYHVTAGRMRAFVERYKGNLQSWASSAEAKANGWDDSWTAKLPKDMTDALYMLGPGQKEGCNVTNQGGRTYWQGAVDGNNAEKSDFTQEVLDEKALNCVPWHLAQAVCHWDGGRLAKTAEIAHVFENRGRAQGKTNYPWEFKAGAAGYNPSNADMRLDHQYSYATPNPPAGMRMVNGQYPLDHAFYMAPPGRRPDGANMHGVMDIAGNMLHWVDDGPRNITWTLSWEKHPKNLTSTVYSTQYPLGYYAIGARCVHD